MAEEAKLADGLVETPPGEPKAEEKAEAKVTEPKVEISDAEAAEIGKLMMASGYTKERINEVLQAPAALEALKYSVKNDPENFLRMLEQADPKAAEKFHDTMADIYVKRHDPGKEPSKGKEGESRLLTEIEDLKGEVSTLKNTQQQRDNAAMMASIKSRYNARIDDLFGQIPADVPLTATEKTAMRALLDRRMAEDPSIIQRASQGNFVDAAPTFQKILTDWSTDKKAAATASEEARKKVEANASSFILDGANPFMFDIPKNAADSWDNTEDALAKALDRLNK